jgi:hypothetical protein
MPLGKDRNIHITLNILKMLESAIYIALNRRCYDGGLARELLLLLDENNQIHSS